MLEDKPGIFSKETHVLHFFFKGFFSHMAAIPFLVSFSCSGCEDQPSSGTANPSTSSEAFGWGQTRRSSFWSQPGSLALESVLLLLRD